MKILFVILLILPNLVSSGPLAYGACQTACNTGAVTCYASHGLIYGTVALTAAGTGPVGWGVWLASAFTSTSSGVATCSAAQGACMTACTPFLLAPTP